MNRTIILFAILALFASCNKSTSDGKTESETKDLSKKRKVLQNKGSDTLVNVAQAWAENYAKVNPDLAIAVTGGGSGTGISAMINGTVDIANASRKMKDKEIDLAKKNGITPVEHTVGYDALAVFIHKDNPMTEATIAQLAGIYGEGGSTDKWSQLNVKIPGCDSDEIVRVSRQNNSGTYAYFKQTVLGETTEYKLGSRDMHGSKDVVDLVEKTPCAIGYSGLAYATDHVKMLCIKKQDGDTCVSPSVETAIDKTYPIARPLFMYTSGAPKGDIKTYMDWILSDKGQCIIKEKGYAPMKEVTCNPTVLDSHLLRSSPSINPAACVLAPSVNVAMLRLGRSLWARSQAQSMVPTS